jgi:hypothetical protein
MTNDFSRITLLVALVTQSKWKKYLKLYQPAGVEQNVTVPTAESDKTKGSFQWSPCYGILSRSEDEMHKLG